MDYSTGQQQQQQQHNQQGQLQQQQPQAAQHLERYQASHQPLHY
jgi:hypothetical protein